MPHWSARSMVTTVLTIEDATVKYSIAGSAFYGTRNTLLLLLAAERKSEFPMGEMEDEGRQCLEYDIAVAASAIDYRESMRWPSQDGCAGAAHTADNNRAPTACLAD